MSGSSSDIRWSMSDQSWFMIIAISPLLSRSANFLGTILPLKGQPVILACLPVHYPLRLGEFHSSEQWIKLGSGSKRLLMKFTTYCLTDHAHPKVKRPTSSQNATSIAKQYKKIKRPTTSVVRCGVGLHIETYRYHDRLFNCSLFTVCYLYRNTQIKSFLKAVISVELHLVTCMVGLLVAC